MTYFLEFHTPRGIFVSRPQDEEVSDSILATFDAHKLRGTEGSIQCPTATGTIFLTTEMIRQTVLAVREAE